MHDCFFCFGEESNSSQRVIILKIELELINLNSILSQSAVTPVFPVGSLLDRHQLRGALGQSPGRQERVAAREAAPARRLGPWRLGRPRQVVTLLGLVAQRYGSGHGVVTSRESLS